MRERLIRVVDRVSKTVITLTAATVMAFSGLAAAGPLFASSVYAATGNTLYVNSSTGDDRRTCLDQANPCRTLSKAIENASDGDTIELGSDLTPTQEITFTKSITLEGNGYTISPNFTNTGSDNNSALGIEADNVTVNDLVEDGAGGTSLHGINIYESSGVSLNNVSISDNDHAAVVVNGSTVEATNLSTSGNGWGAVNVDPGSGVTTPSVFTLNSGTLAESNQIWSDGSYVSNAATVTVNASGYNMYKVAGTTNGYFWTNQPLSNYATISKNGVTTAYSTIQAAVDDAAAGDTIKLGGDMTISSAVVIDKSLTIDGQGHHLNATFVNSGSSNNAAIEILHSDVTIQNLVEDGTRSTNLHGINIYTSTGITLDTVTVSNNGHAGIVVNGSIVTVNDITTDSNGWGGINVDQGSGVSSAANLTVTGTSQQSETTAIWIDDTTKNVQVTDTNHQYSYVDMGNTRVYSLLPDGQTAPDSSGNVALDSSTPTVVVSSGSQPITITVSSGTNNASIDYSSLVSGNTGTIPQTTINSSTATVSIPASTTVTATGGTWDGVIAAPTVQSNTSVSVPTPSGFSTTVGTVIEVGAGNVSLTFNNAVRLLIPGQADKLVGFVRNGDFTQIGNTCAADTQTTGDALPAGGDCYINASNGIDMVIWTKHFTTFVTYSQKKSSSPSNSSGNSTTVTTASSSAPSGDTGGVVQGASTSDNSGKTSSTNTELPVANLSQPKTAAKEATGGGLRWYWVVLIVLAVIGLALTALYRYAEGTDRA